MWKAYLRALTSRRPAVLPEGATVPPLEGRAAKISIDRAHLAAYRAVCGFADDGSIPLTYPHVLGSALQLDLVTSPAFPLRALGLVHIGNTITQHGPIGLGDRLDLHVAIAASRDTKRGHELDLVTTIERDEVVVWTETSTVLARRPGPRATPESPAAAAVTGKGWSAPADIGRRYARVSGDWNPIHVSALTARLFGFPRAIAHGMWSLARVAGELGPGVRTLTVAFKQPVLLPAEVVLETREDELVLRPAAGGKPHLVGTFAR